LSRGPSDLGRRIGTAAVGLPLLLAGLLLGPPILAVAIVAAAALLGALEFFNLVGAGGIAPMRATGFVILAVIFVDVARPGLFPGPVWPLAVVALLASMLLRARDVSLAVPSGGDNPGSSLCRISTPVPSSATKRPPRSSTLTGRRP